MKIFYFYFTMKNAMFFCCDHSVKGEKRLNGNLHATKNTELNKKLRKQITYFVTDSKVHLLWHFE